MGIFKNLKKAHAAVSVDLVKGNPPTLGKQLSNAAVAAILNGIHSPEWKAYMSLFADNTAQLERLTVPKVGEEDYLPLFRAYIVSNSICDITTNTNTINKVDEHIDDNLDQNPDNTVVRPFVIPDV